jgi:hypothetical protein
MKIATSILFLAALALPACEKTDTATPDDATKAETPATPETPATHAEAPTDAPAEGDAAAPAEGEAAPPA